MQKIIFQKHDLSRWGISGVEIQKGTREKSKGQDMPREDCNPKNIGFNYREMMQNSNKRHAYETPTDV